MSKLKERLCQNNDILYDIYTLAYALHDNIEQKIPFKDKDVYRLGKHFNRFLNKVMCKPAPDMPEERDFINPFIERDKYVI